MSLRRKTLVIIGLTLLGLVAVTLVTSRTIMMRGLLEAESHDVRDNVRRVQGAFAQALDDFDTPAADWSKWDDTYAFIEDGNAHYLEANLTDESIATLKLNLLLLIHASGRVVYGTGFDLERGVKTPVPKGLRRHLSPGSPLLHHPDLDRGTVGLICLPEGPMIVAARAILTSEGLGPSRGTLIFGRYLGPELLRRLERVTRLSIDFRRLEGGALPPDFAAVRRSLSEGSAFAVRALSEETIAGYALLEDAYGRPVVMLRAAMSRDVYQEGRAQLRYLHLMLALAGVAFGLVTIFLLERGVLSRLAQLIESVGRIGSSSDPAGRVTVSGRDELASLADSVNQMLASLEHSQERLRASEANYRAIFNAVNDAVFVHDLASGEIIDVNQRMCDMYGYSPEEARRLTVEDLSSGEPPCTLKDALGWIQRAAGGEPQLFEWLAKERTGRLFWVEVNLKRAPIGGQERLLAVVRDITERRQAEERLRYLSLHDSLTGLYSRAYFEQEMRRLEGGRDTPVGIILCDIDGLKLVNDTLGHDSGDALLVAAGEVIRQVFRRGDMVARIGGDEFAVLLAGHDAAVEAAAGRIRAAVAGYNATTPELPLSMSIGFAAHDGPSPHMGELFKEADNAMYREKLHRSQSARSAIVHTLMKALEARDFITEGHADRLQDLVARLAVAIGLSESRVADLRLLAQFHDVGKVGIPDRILFKPGPLSPEERAEMQRHCEIGYRIAQASPDLAPIADWVLKHHESWDGRGYPLGLKGREVPLECRILAIADAYDAMVSDRPYRKALPREEAVAELERCAGTQFDPELVAQFVRVLEAGPALEPAQRQGQLGLAAN